MAIEVTQFTFLRSLLIDNMPQLATITFSLIVELIGRFKSLTSLAHMKLLALPESTSKMTLVPQILGATLIVCIPCEPRTTCRDKTSSDNCSISSEPTSDASILAYSSRTSSMSGSKRS